MPSLPPRQSMQLYEWSRRCLRITGLCVVVHNSTYERLCKPDMLSDPWDSTEISWDTLKLVRKHYKESMQVTNQGSTNIFVIVRLLEAGHTHVKHWWWKNYRWVVAKREISGNNNCSFLFQEKGVLRLDVFHKRKEKNAAKLCFLSPTCKCIM